jgi:hypothetical protein
MRLGSDERLCSLVTVGARLGEACSKLEDLSRRAKAHGREGLIEAVGRALPAVSSHDAKGFFGHRVYHLLDQPL